MNSFLIFNRKFLFFTGKSGYTRTRKAFTRRPLEEMGEAWVRQNWRDYCGVDGGSRELIPETRGSILEGTIC